MAVDFAGCAFVWLLAGLGALSRCGGGIRLAIGGCAGGLDASLQRIDGALEQECEFRKCFRPMVPESFSADEAVCVQRGRIPDAEFYSDAGHDDFGIDCGAMVARGGAEDSVSKVAAGGSCRNRCGIAAACGGDLPGG